MNIRKIIWLALACLTLSGCSKIAISNDSLDGTFWTGSLKTGSSNTHDDISIAFEIRYADFTYLRYGEKDIEEGVLEYKADKTCITFSRANEMLDGKWTVTENRKEKITMHRDCDGDRHIITLQQRR